MCAFNESLGDVVARPTDPGYPCVLIDPLEIVWIVDDFDTTVINPAYGSSSRASPVRGARGACLRFFELIR